MISNLFKETPQNVFVAMLKYLNVKHTKGYSNKFYNEHPHKYNLYGISKMLSDYGIKNTGYKIEDKENNLFNLPVPLVVFFGGTFITVYEINSNAVKYTWNGKYVSITPEKFFKGWQGFALVAESDNYSIEPNYNENRRKELFTTTGNWLLLISVFTLIADRFFSLQLFKSINLTLLFGLNILGVLTGYLLLLKQLKYNSSYSDKICSLFKIGDCNNVLETSASKLFGLISWSEIGLGYFISNVSLILINPGLVSFLALINICALPYTIWSIWYQKFKAKQWCALCLTVQFLIWGVFISNSIFGSIILPDINIASILQICLLYFIPVLSIYILTSKVSGRDKTEKITQELNSLKSNEDVFVTLLKQQPFYEVNRTSSIILWGNFEADTLVTIITNPHCEPCSKMHDRVEKLLESSGENLCIQYLFTYFDTHKDLIASNIFMIGAYLNNDLTEAQKIYKDWFAYGKHERDDFFKVHNGQSKKHNVNEEFQKHEQWVEKNNIKATPTILINGYKLPDNYIIEDLKYFTKLELR